MRISVGNLRRGIVVSRMKGPPAPLRFITPQGNVQNIYTDEPVMFEFEYVSVNPVESITMSGTLPTGLSFSADGVIYGKVTTQIDEVLDFPFTITIVDSENNSITGNFSVQERPTVTEIQWQTPEGEILDSGVGAVIYDMLKAKSTLV